MTSRHIVLGLAILNLIWGAIYSLIQVIDAGSILGAFFLLFPSVWVGIGVGVLIKSPKRIPRALIFLYAAIGVIALLFTVGIPQLQITVWMILLWGALMIVQLLIRHPFLRPRIALTLGMVLFLVIGLEGATRLYMRANHGYDAQSFKPHPELGWTMVPDFEYLWSGNDPACVSFTVEIATNSDGFWDDDANPDDVLKIGVFGDSFIEAKQVDFENRSTEVLEAALNDVGIPTEVYNYGVSNYSVGQNYLGYQHFSQQIDFDIAMILVSDYTVERTQNKFFGDFALRPWFQLKDGELIVNPIEEYDEAMERYSERLDDNGDPIHKPQYLRDPLVNDWVNQPLQSLSANLNFASFGSYRWVHWTQSALLGNGEFSRADFAYFREERPQGMRDLNLAVLDAFAQATAEYGVQFVLIDDAYSPNISDELEAFAQEHDIPYLALNEGIIKANHEGNATSFMCDGHYNELGNQILGNLMAEWVIAETR